MLANNLKSWSLREKSLEENADLRLAIIHNVLNTKDAYTSDDSESFVIPRFGPMMAISIRTSTSRKGCPRERQSRIWSRIWSALAIR